LVRGRLASLALFVSSGVLLALTVPLAVAQDSREQKSYCLVDKFFVLLAIAEFAEGFLSHPAHSPTELS
jgi:hypothetical protein